MGGSSVLKKWLNHRQRGRGREREEWRFYDAGERSVISKMLGVGSGTSPLSLDSIKSVARCQTAWVWEKWIKWKSCHLGGIRKQSTFH
ncbi:hypothetical protein CEXT_806381 [Caerostris extrusa]|uniref:Uncharacterized protein n=1 Tax=Caerostris extrusa TaxID=172846 RepID=A0AAV4UC63_CAEEX|nr:hypothetical protein CEXT_806381 [Caerostris extrusa]